MEVSQVMGLPQNHPFFLVGFSMIKHQAIGVLAFSETPMSFCGASKGHISPTQEHGFHHRWHGINIYQKLDPRPFIKSIATLPNILIKWGFPMFPKSWGYPS
jgi:hypothetical protein